MRYQKCGKRSCIDHCNFFSQDLIILFTKNLTLPLFSTLHLAQEENRNLIHISIIYLQSQGKRMQKGSKDVWADFKEKVSFMLKYTNICSSNMHKNFFENYPIIF